MKALRFWLAIMAVGGLALVGVRHARVVSSLFVCAHAERGETLRQGFAWRLRCVTLSGGFARWLLGRFRSNGVYRTSDGMLLKPALRTGGLEFASDVLAGARALKPFGGTFLYVQMPNKESLDGRVCSDAGCESFENDRCDEILAGLGAEIRVVDLRPVVSATARDVRANFLRTDHHWNFEGAFKAFRHLVPILLAATGTDDSAADRQLDGRNWVRMEIPRPGARFLGSWGRRTGPWFAGFDRMDYLVPAFATDFQAVICNRTGKVSRRTGDFQKVFVNSEAISQPHTWYEDYGYDVYLGDQARVEVVNESAPVRKSVLFVKDSFSQPLIAWMSTVFAKVTAVDPRLCSGCLADEVRASRPDVTVVSISYCRPGFFTPSDEKDGARRR